jgi:transposase
MPHANPPTAFIGCDVGKSTIVIHDSRTRRTIVVNNKPSDIAVFARRLDANCLVVCEATGGHELALLAALLEAGIPCHRADGRRVKGFIRSLGSMAKTDKIDAAGLAEYGRERHARLIRWQAHDTARDRLRSLVHARLDLVATCAEYRTRRTAPQAEAAKPFLDAVIETLDAQIKAIVKELKAEIKRDQALDEAVKLLCSIKGIGFVTAVGLIALMPELGTLDRRRIASLGGLAPHPHQSGALDKRRFVHGGRYGVKSLLFMAALTAARFHPELSAFYERKRAEGKLKMVAVVAVMRKLLVICNAVLKQAAEKKCTTAQTPDGATDAGQNEASMALKPLSPPPAGVKPLAA